jgi:CheY-like chemotaxis protein
LETSAHITGVIVADDDPLIRSVMRAKFEAIGLNVFPTADGLEAVELASRIRALLIILDLNMPRLNGLLACTRIRQLPGNADTPIVILTSLIGKRPEAAAAQVGATAYFLKPFRPAVLLQALSRFLPINDATRALIHQNADLVSDIAKSVPRSPEQTDLTLDKPRSGGALDRGKDVLDVLRGQSVIVAAGTTEDVDHTLKTMPLQRKRGSS